MLEVQMKTKLNKDSGPRCPDPVIPESSGFSLTYITGSPLVPSKASSIIAS